MHILKEIWWWSNTSSSHLSCRHLKKASWWLPCSQSLSVFVWMAFICLASPACPRKVSCWLSCLRSLLMLVPVPLVNVFHCPHTRTKTYDGNLFFYGTKTPIAVGNTNACWLLNRRKWQTSNRQIFSIFDWQGKTTKQKATNKQKRLNCEVLKINKNGSLWYKRTLVFWA